MKPIQVAISSFGMSGQLFHAPFITAHPGFNFYAVLERTKNIAEQYYPQVKLYRNIEALLADEVIELLIINTPNTLHFDFCKQALMAGKHVICEKPFTVTVAEADELIDLAAKKKCFLSVYHNRRYDSDFKTIREVLQKKLLGNMVEAEFHFDRYRNEISSKKHKEIPVTGTGAVYDLGSHLIDQALVLFGMPESVYADIAIMRPVSSVDDFFEILLYYNNFRVRLRGSYLVREALPGYILHGSNGSFIKPKTDMQELQLQNGFTPIDEGYGIEPPSEQGLLHTTINGKLIREHYPSQSGNYMEYYEGIYRSLRLAEALPVSAESGRDVVRIIEAAFKSNQAGKRWKLEDGKQE